MIQLEHDVYEALGEASMCWSETPKGIFQSKKATEIGEKLMIKINSRNSALIETVIKYYELKEKISEFYPDDEGNVKNEGDLCDIGEICAIHFGFL